MSPRLSVTATNDVVRQVALQRGLQAKLSELFPAERGPAATVAAAWNALLLTGVAQVDKASDAETIQAETVLQVDVEVAGDNQVVVIAGGRRIPVEVGDEHVRVTLWQAFESLQALVRGVGHGVTDPH